MERYSNRLLIMGSKLLSNRTERINVHSAFGIYLQISGTQEHGYTHGAITALQVYNSFLNSIFIIQWIENVLVRKQSIEHFIPSSATLHWMDFPIFHCNSRCRGPNEGQLKNRSIAWSICKHANIGWENYWRLGVPIETDCICIWFEL